MKTFTSTLRCVLLLGIGFLATVAMAKDSPVATMAGILEQLNHFPNAEQKAVLVDIAGDENNGDAVQAIATAIHDMQHKVSGEDATKLAAIAANDDNDEDVRSLAAVVLDIEHKPSAEAVQTLQSLQ